MGGVDVQPTATRSGPACSADPIDPSVSASTTEAPPCSRPYGWVLPSTGMVATSRCGAASTISMPIRSVSVPVPIARTEQLVRLVTSVPGPAGLVSVMGGDRCRSTRTESRRRHSDGSRQPAAPPRRALARLPRLLRAAGGELLDHHRPATNAVYGFTSMLINVLRDEDADPRRRRVRRVAQDLPHRAVPRVQGQPHQEPRRLQRPGRHWSRRCSRRCASRRSRPRATRPTTSSRRSRRAPSARASTCSSAPATATRSSWCSDQVTVLYPRKGVSDMWRFTPAAMAEKYGLTPSQYPDFAALRGDPSDNLPNIPAVGEKTATKWIVEFGDLDDLVERVDEVKGKAGDALRAHLAQVIQNRQLTELVRDVPDRRDAGRPGARRTGSATRCTRSSTRWSSGCCATGSTRPSSRPSPRPTRASTVTCRVLATGELAALARRARARRPPHRRAHLRATGVRARATWPGVALAAADGEGAWFDPTALDSADETGLRRLAGRRRRAQGAARRQGPVPRVRCARLGPARGHQRHRSVGVPRDARPAQLRPGRPGAALPAPRAARRGRRRRGQLSFDGQDEAAAAEADVVRARAVLELADAPRHRARGEGSPPHLLRDVELPLVEVLAAMERTGIAVDPDHLADARGALRGRGEGGGRRGVRRASARRSTSARRSSCRWCSSTSSACPRPSAPRPATPPTPRRCRRCTRRTTHPFLAALLRHRDASRLKVTVDGLLKTVADDGRIHTTFNQIIAATGRLSSTDPNLQNIPIRTEEGRRIREAFIVGAGYESLLTADYSQIEMRIMAHLSEDAGADRGLPLGRGPARVHRVAGLRRRAGRREPRAAGQDQGDVLRPGLRPVAPTACPASSASRPRRPRA